jgi:hypothetical protein
MRGSGATALDEEEEVSVFMAAIVSDDALPSRAVEVFTNPLIV